MTGIVICGGGVAGLFTGMLFAGDGHEVTVLERDAAPPPSPFDAWDGWERRGVNQFRLPHFLMPRFREVCEAELPGVVDGLRAAGARCFNPLDQARDVLPGGDRLDIVTARRPVLEAVLGALADDTPNLDVRRGVGVAGLVTGTEALPGVPNVTGVRTESGDVLDADLVIVAGGRRSSFDRWLAEIGARPAQFEEEDSGFVYYGRHVRMPDGAPFISPGAARTGSIALLALPADNDTYGVGVIGTSDDTALRPLKHGDVWERVVRALPNGPLIVDEATPVSDNVSMTRIEDRWHRYVVDGQPVATGALAVADAAACTNPTLGRGISLGAIHAVALRDCVRDNGSDPAALALAFDDVSQRLITPWYRSTVWQDRHTVAIYRQFREDGVMRLPTGDRPWDDFLRMQRVLPDEPDLMVRALGASMLFDERPEQVVADPDVQAKIHDVELVAEPDPGPSRAELLSLIAG